MHSSFWQRADGDHGGDLGDVVRSGGVHTDQDRWQLPAITEAEEGDQTHSPPQTEFGELHDPLLPELGTGQPSGFYGSVTLLSSQEASGEEILSRVLQISPAPPVAGPLLGRTTSDPAGQIASPRNPGIKMRRSLAKKVVCIPAPPSTGGRQSSEAVPSDLWAWRKYGQKPIKGSPYPRGYYRCSSSKGCLARKQVERSRTDPNMLVITYTSEHNHPWPTHRNALVGTTRSLPSPPSSSSTSRLLPLIEFPKDIPADAGTANSIGQSVKEEAKEIDQMPVEDPWLDNESCNSIHSDDLFADLGELGSESMDLVFSKALDPFSPFDWGANPFESDRAKKGGL